MSFVSVLWLTSVWCWLWEDTVCLVIVSPESLLVDWFWCGVWVVYCPGEPWLWEGPIFFGTFGELPPHTTRPVLWSSWGLAVWQSSDESVWTSSPWLWRGILSVLVSAATWLCTDLVAAHISDRLAGLHSFRHSCSPRLPSETPSVWHPRGNSRRDFLFGGWYSLTFSSFLDVCFTKL